ncbi:MAG: hydroxymethylbilane synthase [Vicinamibacterales bacterium]
MSRRLRLGARGSALSLSQVDLAVRRLTRHGIATELTIFSSTGDRDRESPIAELASDAPFVDDVEAGLRDGSIDVAIHSLKDMAIEPPEDLAIGAVLRRGSITESLVSTDGSTLRNLRTGAVIGTSSERRRLQIRHLRPDLVCKPIRGPVDHRLVQVREGAFDAVVFATAGLERLHLDHEIVETFTPRFFAPAPGQGAIALQVRADDVAARSALAAIDDFSTRLATDAERSVERRLDALGHLVAAWAEVEHAGVTLHVRVWAHGEGDPIDVSSAGVNPDHVAREASERALDAIADGVAAR